MSTSFVHLQLHTEYSLADGLVRVKPLMKAEVRGTVWHDVNGDGRRQPWEVPLAGIAVTLGEQTTFSDAQGRFQFIGIDPGQYLLEAVLPGELHVPAMMVTVGSDRGKAVGIAARVDDLIFRDGFE